jgi:large subunit ribosomal protein L6e
MPKASKISKDTPRFYPADDVKQPIKSRHVNKKTKLRASIKAGTVLIVLSGRFRGKRVVFLKQLDSGLLLVTGPYKINGVPLRRVNQAYVIATQTSVDISSVKVPANVNDAFFKRSGASAASGEDAFFSQDAAKVELSADRKSAQKAVDAAVLKAVKAVPSLDKYLNAKFSLTKGQRPHDMVF